MLFCGFDFPLEDQWRPSKGQIWGISLHFELSYAITCKYFIQSIYICVCICIDMGKALKHIALWL